MKINEIELASILADQQLNIYAKNLSAEDFKQEFPNGLLIEDEDETSYTEEAQDVFNEYYDEYLTLIESCQL